MGRRTVTPMQIEIAKMMGIDPSRITRRGLVIGDLRDELANDMFRRVRSVMYRERKRRAPYWLMVHANARPGSQTIKTTVMIHDKQPPKLLGTMCFKLDNAAGRVTREWVLPLDIPRPGVLVTDDTALPVAEAAQGMPILN